MSNLPDNFNAAAFDAYWEGDADRNRYERDKLDEARDTLTIAWAALIAARAAFKRVSELRHDYEAGHSYDPTDFCGYIDWEMGTVRDVAKAYGVVLEPAP